jgi:hypothetical protein
MGVFLLCMLVAGAAFAAGGYLGLIESVQKLDGPRTYETHPTYIYSAPLGGNEDSRRVIGTIIEGQNRKMASLSEMPPHLLDAVVAKEDERFREHGGVDLWGIMRALWVDIRAGKAVEGREDRGRRKEMRDHHASPRTSQAFHSTRRVRGFSTRHGIGLRHDCERRTQSRTDHGFEGGKQRG